MATHNWQWILARRPVGEIKDGDLVFRADPIPNPEKGEVVVKTEWLSLDPTNRIWMSDIRQYMPPVALGAPMRGLICGTVVKSASDSVAEGAVVMGLGTWSDYACVPAATVSPVPKIKGIPLKDVFGQMCLIGPTAYFGLTDIGAPKIGETLVVSGAAGAVGSIAGQLGKVLGCKTVGIAGGKGEVCVADPRLRLRPRHRLQERDYRTALTCDLPRRHRYLFRQCRRRDAEHISRPNEPVWPHRPVRHDLGL